jgi:uncharacterized protein with ParB-like and HNH nuclease domain
LELKKIALRIPSYQRPYVWSADDVLKLLGDIIAAFEAKEPHYYIGTVLSSQRRNTYELIDGQQRMTTLMLMVSAFGTVYPEGKLKKLAALKRQSRLTFAIREQVQALLAHWAGLTEYTVLSGETIQRDEYLQPLYSAYKALTNRFAALLDSSPGQLADLAYFIQNNVKWVNNIVPAGLDLNRLFTTMNTGGVQLEQSDILKSALLKKMTQDSYRYDAIWQACENMGNYFERNLRKLFPDADWKRLKYDDLSEYSREKFPLERSDRGAGQGKSIPELAASSVRRSVDKDIGKKVVSDDTDVYCRSTVSFPLLLIHAFRIFRNREQHRDIGTRVIDTQLNRCFADFVTTATEREVKAFLRCLWKVRYQFDRWVVKWVHAEADGGEHLCLASVHYDRSKGRLSRRVEKMADLVQLQSVRNFSGERSAQYWLTPFLGRLIERGQASQSAIEGLLEGIDNQLSLTKRTQKEASFILIDDDCHQQRHIDEVCDDLAKPKGTAFEHYWFQKLEYVLWRHRADLQCFDLDKLSDYRITSKNSIEHVHPQNEKHDLRLDDADLHAFGNLVLLSPGENSAYSNKPVPVKRAEFHSKPRYDALKLAHIFDKKKRGDWDANSIAKHQSEMLSFLRSHYVEE